MQDSVFVVQCQRVPRKKAYKIAFPYNDQMIERIKEFPSDDRKWHGGEKVWELKTKTLFDLIKSYKGSKKIHFDFNGAENRMLFIKQLKEIELAEEKHKKTLEELKIKKARWVKWKEELETNHVKYSDEVHSKLKEGTKLYPHQIIATLYLNEARNALISHEMGLGKAQDLDSNLLTPNGWVKMGDINVGDYVIGSDGKPKEVLGVFPQGSKNMYEITFNDGTITRSCDEHLWNVNTYIRNWRKNPYLTKTLREIIDGGLQFKNGDNKWYIPIVKPIEFEDKKLKIDPYVLGCILGDGGITVKNSISFSSIDSQIINEIQKRLPDKHNLVLDKNSLIDYHLTADGKNNLINQALKIYNLSGKNSHNKFIPSEYLYSSIPQRFKLLQGILDTDGHSRKDSVVELTLASKQLIDDVQFIVQSLGGIGRVKEKWITYKGERKLYWRITIKLPQQFIPFKLKRKRDTFKPPTKYLPNRAIVDIKYVGKKEAQCILINSDDHLYCTDNCILTHNTLVSIAFAEMNDFKKVLVVTPNSLKFNYYNEVNKFTNSNAHVVNWRKNSCSLEDAKYVIVNYEYFNSSDKRNMEKKWKNLKIDVLDAVFCDESHRLKNSSSNTYKNFKHYFGKPDIFRDKKECKVFLTGTPAPNRAYELYTVLNQISPIDFPTKKYFYEYYCGMTYDYYNGWGWESSGESHLEELYHKIAPYTHRKRKKEVLTDLPDKIYQRVVLDMSNKDYKTYEDIESGVANEFTINPTINPLTVMLRLRQYTSHLKVKEVIELVENILETGEKVVVVDVFKESLLTLKEKFGDIAGLHTGDQSVEERAEIIKQFQDPDSNMKIFLGSIQTCNYGLTLTAASKLFILTLPYSVGEYDQVADRCHRIGQKDIVNIYAFIFPETIDDYVYSAIESKRTEIVKVIDNEDYTSTTEESVLHDVISKIKSKYGK